MTQADFGFTDYQPTFAPLSQRRAGTPIPILATFAIFLAAGTGGIGSPSSIPVITGAAMPTTSACRITHACNSAQVNVDEIAGTTEGLAIIQHYLSLNISDLASALRVSRPTVYAWLREESEPQANNISRIQIGR